MRGPAISSNRELREAMRPYSHQGVAIRWISTLKLDKGLDGLVTVSISLDG